MASIPRNFAFCRTQNCEALGHNPLCGDKLVLYLRVNDKGAIDDANISGQRLRYFHRFGVDDDRRC